jgi:Zn-dependent protease with chaperone function
MHVAVYLPLVLPLFAAGSARWLAARLHPSAATWLLTAAALGMAVTSGLALTALAATAIGQLPPLALLGDWSAQLLHRDDPASLPIGLLACLLLTVALAATGTTLAGRARGLLDAARSARRLPTLDPLSQVVVVDDPCPDAYALPGVPGRIVVSTGMLAGLDDRERQALFAHERAHLSRGHHLFVALAHLAAAANPLLRPVAAAVSYATERWADEAAAAAVGDRRVVARTIGKAALMTRHRPGVPRGALAVADGSGFAPDLRGAGPVPRRVGALLVTPPRTRRWAMILILAVLLLAVASTVEAVCDLHLLFELAETGQS